MTQILIFGASTTYGAWDSESGWVQRLRKYIDDKIIKSNYELYHLVYNLGIDGDNSKGLLKRFKKESKPRMWKGEETIFIFSIGANDSLFNNRTKKNKISLDDYKSNFREILKQAKEHTKNIIILGLMPVDETKVDPVPWLKTHSYKNEIISQYNKTAENLAEEEQVNFISMYNHFINKNYNDFLSDGVHPNAEGHKQMFEIVKNILVDKKLIPE